MGHPRSQRVKTDIFEQNLLSQKTFFCSLDFLFIKLICCFWELFCFLKLQKASPNSSLIDFIKTGSMNLGAVDAQDLARQPIEPGNYYRFKHGSIGGRPVSPNFLAGTNLTKRCTFERLDKFNCEEHTLQHSLGLKWWVIEIYSLYDEKNLYMKFLSWVW